MKLKKIICFIIMFFAINLLEASEIPQINIGYIPIIPQLPLIISYENDNLNLYSVKLKLIKYNSFTSLEAAMRVGVIDACSIPLPIAYNIYSNITKCEKCYIRIIGIIHKGGSSLISKSNGNLSTMKDKLIGTPGLDSVETMILNNSLKNFNMRFGLEYKTIEIVFNTAINDLKKSKLDALFIPEPYGTVAIKNSSFYLVDDQKKYFSNNLITALVIQSDFLTSKKKAVLEWLESIYKACIFIENDIKNSNAKQCAIIQSKYFGFQNDVVVESLTNRLGNLKFDNVIPEINELNNILKYCSSMKLVTKSVDLKELVFLDIMKSIHKNNGKN